MIEAITSIRRCTPLLLPYLETSLRDTSPNSKEQAAMALLRLVEKHGWSREMSEGARMTEEEEKRWSELIVVLGFHIWMTAQSEFVESPAKSTQENALLRVIEHISREKEPEWRDRWALQARSFVEKNPVNVEIRHWTWIVRCVALADPGFFSDYLQELWNSICSTENQDIM